MLGIAPSPATIRSAEPPVPPAYSRCSRPSSLAWNDDRDCRVPSRRRRTHSPAPAPGPDGGEQHPSTERAGLKKTMFGFAPPPGLVPPAAARAPPAPIVGRRISAGTLAFTPPGALEPQRPPVTTLEEPIPAAVVTQRALHHQTMVGVARPGNCAASPRRSAEPAAASHVAGTPGGGASAGQGDPTLPCSRPPKPPEGETVRASSQRDRAHRRFRTSRGDRRSGCVPLGLAKTSTRGSRSRRPRNRSTQAHVRRQRGRDDREHRLEPRNLQGDPGGARPRQAARDRQEHARGRRSPTRYRTRRRSPTRRRRRLPGSRSALVPLGRSAEGRSRSPGASRVSHHRRRSRRVTRRARQR